VIKIIIKREILEYFKSSKFLIGLLLTVVLITISTVINIGDYQQRQQDYLDASKDAEKSFRVEIFRQPQMLSTLVLGKDRKLGNRLEFNYLNLPTRTSGYMGFASQHQRYFSGFAAVDFAFVVRVVLSLLVIFLAYNAVSEEKARGTLKLALSNYLPRDQFILGKFLGGLFVILGSLLFATLIAIFIMMVHPSISLSGSILVRITSMFGISALFLICFYTITLFVSVSANRPAISLLILLQIWIFLIVIYPNLGVVLSKQLIKLPSPEQIAQQKQASFEPIQDEYEKSRDAFSEMVQSGKSDKEIQLKNVELAAKRTELWYQVDKDFVDRLTYQMKVAQNISMLSPAVLYNMAINRYAQTDIVEFDSFMEGIERTWYKYVDRFKLRYTNLEAYRKEEFPEFSYISDPIEKNLAVTLPQWIIMFLFSLFFFVLSYVKFLRKDVR